MNWRKILSMFLVAVVAVSVVAIAVSNGNVAAQTPTPTQQPKDPQAQAANAAARLEKLYQAELKMVDNQATNFGKVTDLTSKVNALIAKAKANGKDTSVLEAGLTQFTAKTSDAQKIHDGAASLLQAHVGFDANGKVVDRAAARDTLQNGRSQLQDARQLVGQAIKDFRQTVKTWRDANQAAKPATKATPGI
jgi:hypothetical protein